MMCLFSVTSDCVWKRILLSGVFVFLCTRDLFLFHVHVQHIIIIIIIIHVPSIDLLYLYPMPVLNLVNFYSIMPI